MTPDVKLSPERVRELRDWRAPVPPGTDRKQRQPTQCWELLTAVCDHYLATAQGQAQEVITALGKWLLHDESCASDNNAEHVGAQPCDCGLDAAIRALSASQRKECETCKGTKVVGNGGSMNYGEFVTLPCPDCTGQRKETP